MFSLEFVINMLFIVLVLGLDLEGVENFKFGFWGNKFGDFGLRLLIYVCVK